MRELASRFMQALTSGSLNDISYEEMNRIVRRLKKMPASERMVGVKVGKVLVEELGVKKANSYVEKALADGLISTKEYDELKAAVTLHVPREKLPPSWAGRGQKDLVQAQQKIRSDVSQLTSTGKKVIEAPLRALDKDVERLRKAWGMVGRCITIFTARGGQVAEPPDSLPGDSRFDSDPRYGESANGEVNRLESGSPQGLGGSIPSLSVNKI